MGEEAALHARVISPIIVLMKIVVCTLEDNIHVIYTNVTTHPDVVFLLATRYICTYVRCFFILHYYYIILCYVVRSRIRITVTQTTPYNSKLDGPNRMSSFLLKIRS